MATPPIETLQQAWEAFQATGRCAEEAIAPPILRSWQRCAALRLDPLAICRGADEATTFVPDAAQEALITLARPSMEDLYQFVEGSGFAVLLADPALTVIEVVGDPQMLEVLQFYRHARGASWR